MEVPVSKARDRFSELVSQTEYGRQTHILHRRGKPVDAVVPIEDLEKSTMMYVSCILAFNSIAYRIMINEAECSWDLSNHLLLDRHYGLVVYPCSKT